MKMDLFGQIRVREGYDPDDEPVAARKAAELQYFGEYSRDVSRGPFKYGGQRLF